MSQRSYNLLSVTEAARQLNKTKFFIYDEIHRGHLTCYKIGDGFAIKQGDLDDYVNARCQKAFAPKPIKPVKSTTPGLKAGA